MFLQIRRFVENDGTERFAFWGQLTMDATTHYSGAIASGSSLIRCAQHCGRQPGFCHARFDEGTGDGGLGSDGSFYRTTFDGGSPDNGTVFRITQAGAFSTLYSFKGKTAATRPPNPPAATKEDSNKPTAAPIHGLPAGTRHIHVISPLPVVFPGVAGMTCNTGRLYLCADGRHLNWIISQTKTKQ